MALFDQQTDPRIQNQKGQELLDMLAAKYGQQPAQVDAERKVAGMSPEEELPPGLPRINPMGSFGAGVNLGRTPEEKAAIRAQEEELARQNKALEGDVAQQRAFQEAQMRMTPQKNINPLLEYGYRVAGRDPAEVKATLAAATPQSGEEMRAALQKTLSQTMEGQNKLSDNQKDMLKTMLSNSQNNAMLRGAYGQEKQAQNMFSKAGHDLNEFIASSRSVLGKSADALANIQKAAALTSSVKDPNQLIPQQVHELNEAQLKIIAGGGGGSEGRLNKLSQDTLGMKWAEVQQYLSGKPYPGNAGEFVKLVSHMLEREAGTLQGIVEKGKQGIFQQYNPILAGNPSTAPAWRGLHEYHGIDPYGRPIKKEEAHITQSSAEVPGGNGKMSFEEWKKAQGR